MLLAAPACAQREQATAGADPVETLEADTSHGWLRPRSNEREAERRAMVRRQIANRGVRASAVLDAVTKELEADPTRIVEVLFKMAEAATPHYPADDQTAVVLRT